MTVVDSVRPLLGKMRQKWLRRNRLTLVSSAMVREARAVRAGHGLFERDSHRIYTVRRNIHMLEKGLVMRPRRDTFALDYIGPTLDIVLAQFNMGLLDPDSEEGRWVLSVLRDYFHATRDSSSAHIAAQRERFANAVATIDLDAMSSGPHVVEMAARQDDFDTIQRLSVSRRSVRWFTQDAVPRLVVDRAIAVAIEAPTACNRSPYRFEIFDERADVERIADLAMGTRGYGHQIAGLVVVVGRLDAFFDERDRHLIYIDSSLASMSLIYGLESQGIGSCIINWPDIPERELKIKRVLGLSESERVVMLIAYGYPLPGSQVPYSAKQPLDKVRSFRSTKVTD